MAKTREDLVGRVFGFWTILENAEDRIFGSQRKRVVVAKCKCGTIRSVLEQNIISGQSSSCGCYQRTVAKEFQDKLWAKRKQML
jgi:hypothetical protein